MRVPPDPLPPMPGQWQTSDEESSSQGMCGIDTLDTSIVQDKCFQILDLPLELIDHILGYLSPPTLARLSQTCKKLATRASEDRLWKGLLADSIPDNRYSHHPFGSWREMYGSHYPYWFLPKHKIWFADRTTLSNPMTGQLILVRYDQRIGSIEGYRLRAEQPENTMVIPWSHHPSVHIYHFRPRVSMFLDDPVIKLNPESFEPGRSRLQQEVPLSHNRHTGGAIRSRILPSIPIAPAYQAPSMSLWPPYIIPAPERVRTESPSLFQDPSHKPSTFEEMSSTTFRIRKWLAFSGLTARLGFRTAEDVITYSTLLPEHYTPTLEKPYQGLWVGDYAGHGVEFLLILQSTPEEARTMPPVVEDPPRDVVDELLPPALRNLAKPNLPDTPGWNGRLDAIKLTGDPNVPRGQLSWVAEDISSMGLLRIADEHEFRGSRVVKSHGHIAHTGFRENRYTPSQLIMISENKLAQYWVEMGHISYFRRIDIDDYLRFPDGIPEDAT